MLIHILKGKIHRATVTDSNLDYDGSIAIDADLMKAANIIPYERVDIYNITNGERLTTYAILAEGGSGTISMQGAAAHKARKGDLIIICAYSQMPQEEALGYKPAIILVDKNNRQKK